MTTMPLTRSVRPWALHRISAHFVLASMSWSGSRRLLGAAHRGIHHTPLDPLRSTFEWVREFTVLPDLPAPCVAWLLETDSAQRLIQLRDATGKLSERIEAWRELPMDSPHSRRLIHLPLSPLRIRNALRPKFAPRLRKRLVPSRRCRCRPIMSGCGNGSTDHYHDELLSFLKRRGLPVQKLAVLATRCILGCVASHCRDESTGSV